ncbi:MAG TPA: type II toxin-antitoxin system HicB family antitoxin [Arthrobacter sp.]|nr:type II toxin-antitoxin system HicB family antitoxin [Arthrobacter sp.]
MNNEERVAEVLARPYSFIAVADQDDGGWVIFYPDLPGVMTQTDTYEEVAVMARDALETWVEAAVEDGRSIPKPTFDADPEWDWDTVRPLSDVPSLTTAEVADELGISVPRVHQLARSRCVGERRGNMLMFSKKDVDAMCHRKPGRPAHERSAV